MGKKPTVLSLLMEIKNLLEGKAVVAPILQPRIINERFTDNGDGAITDKENKTLIVKDPPKPNCCCGEIELKAGVQVVGNIAHCKTKPCYITTKPKPTCEHEWDFTGKWICIKCKKVRKSVDVLGNPEPKPEQIELLPKDAPYIDHIMNRMCEKINELIRAYNGR